MNNGGLLRNPWAFAVASVISFSSNLTPRRLLEIKIRFILNTEPKTKLIDAKQSMQHGSISLMD